MSKTGKSADGCCRFKARGKSPQPLVAILLPNGWVLDASVCAIIHI
jgi:hypothetical protein